MIQEAIQYVCPDKIVCEPQIRREFSESELLGLARSIQELGFQQPIRVRRDGERFIVVVGERRLRAAILAKARQIPVIVEERTLCEAEILHRQLVENLQRVDFLPSERAVGLNRLIETTGWTMKEAAAKCGLSSATASKLLGVLSLPEEIRKGVDAGDIPLSSAYALHRVRDPQKQAALAQQVTDGSLNRDEVTDAVQRECGQSGKRASRRVATIVTGGQSVTISGASLTVEQVVAALEEFLAKARRALRRGLDVKGLASSLREAAQQ